MTDFRVRLAAFVLIVAIAAAAAALFPIWGTALIIYCVLGICFIIGYSIFATIRFFYRHFVVNGEV